jgi:uncharacterized protein
MQASEPSAFPDEAPRSGDDSSPRPAASEPPDFQKLDRRVVQLWRISNAIGFAVFFGMIVIASTIFFFSAGIFGAWVFVFWGALFLFFAFMVLWHPPRAYRAWGYRIDDKVFEARQGIFFRVIHLLPLSRLQHVDLHRGPLERAHGLASLILYTAGSHSAALVVPGLDAEEAKRLRDHLVEIGGDDAV